MLTAQKFLNLAILVLKSFIVIKEWGGVGWGSGVVLILLSALLKRENPA